MQQSVKVIVKNCIGREKNPYSQIEDDIFGDKVNLQWIKFEQSIKEYPAPGIDDGEHLCIKKLQEQLPPYTEWADCEIDGYDPIVQVGKGAITRQIYTLYQPVPDKVQKLHDMSTPLKEGDRFYQPVEKVNSETKICGHDCGCLDMSDCHFKVEKEVKTEEEKSLEVAAAEYFEADINDLGLCDKIFINGAKFGLAYADRKTASLRNEVERLRKALEEIANAKYDTYNRRIATKALTQPK